MEEGDAEGGERQMKGGREGGMEGPFKALNTVSRSRAASVHNLSHSLGIHGGCLAQCVHL